MILFFLLRNSNGNNIVPIIFVETKKTFHLLGTSIIIIYF